MHARTDAGDHECSGRRWSLARLGWPAASTSGAGNECMLRITSICVLRPKAQPRCKTRKYTSALYASVCLASTAVSGVAAARMHSVWHRYCQKPHLVLLLASSAEGDTPDTQGSTAFNYFLAKRSAGLQSAARGRLGWLLL